MFLLETRFYGIYGELLRNITKHVTCADPLYRTSSDGGTYLLRTIRVVEHLE